VGSVEDADRLQLPPGCKAAYLTQPRSRRRCQSHHPTTEGASTTGWFRPRTILLATQNRQEPCVALRLRRSWSWFGQSESSKQPASAGTGRGARCGGLLDRQRRDLDPAWFEGVDTAAGHRRRQRSGSRWSRSACSTCRTSSVLSWKPAPFASNRYTLPCPRIGMF